MQSKFVAESGEQLPIEHRLPLKSGNVGELISDRTPHLIDMRVPVLVMYSPGLSGGHPREERGLGKPQHPRLQLEVFSDELGHSLLHGPDGGKGQ